MKHSFWHFLFCSLTLGCILITDGHAQLLDFKCYSQGAGFEAAGAFDLAEDSLGRLLIATEGSGLMRYDGTQFEIWDRGNGAPADTIRCVYFTGKEALVGTEGAGLWLFQNDAFAEIDLGTDEKSAVRDFAEAPNGLVYIATLGQGLYRYENGLASPVEDCPERFIRSLLWASDSSLYLGTDNGLLHWNQKGFDYLQPEDSAFAFPNSSILCLYEDGFGQKWAGTAHGPLLFDEQSYKAFARSGLQEERIRCISEDSHQDLWFGTQTGLFEWSREEDEVHRYTTLNGLSNERIRHLHHDRSGSLWIATYFGGICQLAGQEVVHFNRDQGFPESLISALLLPNDSAVWLGTYDGGLYRWTEASGAQKLYQTQSGFQKNTILSIQERSHEDGLIAVSTEHDGTIYFSEESQPKMLPGTKPKPAFYGRILKELETTQGTSVIGELAASFNGAAISAAMLGVERFTDGVASDSTLILGTNSGLFVLSTSAIKETGKHQWGKTPQALEGSENYEIVCLSLDRTGQVWVGTARDGLFRYNGRSFKAQAKRHLPDKRIQGIALDPLQDLWVVSRGGITHLELDPTQELILASESFGPEQGLMGQLNGQSMQWDALGQLWIGSTRGLFRISPSERFPNTQSPGLWLKGIRLNYEEVNWSEYLGTENEENARIPEELTLPFTDNHLTFDFAGIDLSDPSQLIYQVRLEGYDPDWIDLGQRNTQTYPNLPPGAYSFQLRARNSKGIWNEVPLAFQFEIRPPFYASPWFILLCAVALVLLIVLFVRWRIRALEAKNKQLDRAVKERTKELRQEKEKSERLLLNILPRETAEELKENGSAKARSYPQASVLFADLKGFTMMTEKVEANELVSILDDAFRAFDKNCDIYGVEKIKTIGDAYMCAAGIPAEHEDHAQRLVRFALAMIASMEVLNRANEARGLPRCELRVGIHSGPIIAGVVGEKKFAYDIWGDTVNTASRMESSGEAGKVNISAGTYALVKDHFVCESRGWVKAKNKGELEMYFVHEEIAL